MTSAALTFLPLRTFCKMTHTQDSENLVKAIIGTFFTILLCFLAYIGIQISNLNERTARVEEKLTSQLAIQNPPPWFVDQLRKVEIKVESLEQRIQSKR